MRREVSTRDRRGFCSPPRGELSNTAGVSGGLTCRRSVGVCRGRLLHTAPIFRLLCPRTCPLRGVPRCCLPVSLAGCRVPAKISQIAVASRGGAIGGFPRCEIPPFEGSTRYTPTWESGRGRHSPLFRTDSWVFVAHCSIIPRANSPASNTFLVSIERRPPGGTQKDASYLLLWESLKFVRCKGGRCVPGAVMRASAPHFHGRESIPVRALPLEKESGFREPPLLPKRGRRRFLV